MCSLNTTQKFNTGAREKNVVDSALAWNMGHSMCWINQVPTYSLVGNTFAPFWLLPWTTYSPIQGVVWRFLIKDPGVSGKISCISGFPPLSYLLPRFACWSSWNCLIPLTICRLFPALAFASRPTSPQCPRLGPLHQVPETGTQLTTGEISPS